MNLSFMKTECTPPQVEALPQSTPTERRFLTSAAVILALTGGAKLVSAMGTAQALEAPEPITGISFGWAMIGTGVVEIIVALICLVPWNIAPRLAALAWISSNFLAYRTGLWIIGWRKPCSCLGTLTESIHLNPEAADHLMKIVLAYLFAGSVGLWIARRARSRPSREAKVA